MTVIVPWSAGGGTDRVSRQIAFQLERELNTPVNVVNATGGAGVTGHTRGALARPDGYTLTMITPELAMLHWRGLTNITFRDFEPLVLLNRDNAALFVRRDAPWRTLAELEQEIRDNPGRRKAAGTAFGGIWHIGVAGWMNAVDLTPNHVRWISLNGSAPSLQELMAGGVDLVCCSVPEAQSLLDAGEVRCLGLMADERMASLPDVPTFRESGVPWSLGGWRGLALPLETPDDRRRMIQTALERVVQSDEYRKFLNQANFGYAFEEAGEFRKTLAQSDAQYGEILTSDAFRQVQRQRYGPMLFPGLLAAMAAIAAVGLAITGGFRRSDEAPPLSRNGAIRVFVAIACVLAFIAAAEIAGFVITTALAALILLLTLRTRLRIALPVAVLLSAAVWQVFAVFLRVPLPWGWLGW